MESLEQIAAFDVEKLLSKSAALSENLLLQLRQSLTEEWGTGSVDTLPEDFHSETPNSGMVYLELLYFSIIYVVILCFNPFSVFKIPTFP